MQSERALRAFTLIELMIVVAIVGILAATAIPNFRRFQLRAKSSEAKLNLQAIRSAQASYLAEFGYYVAASASPPSYGGSEAQPFVDSGPTGANFSTIGWRPEGVVYFHYAVNVAGEAYTADAAADIDGNSVPQLWGYLMPDIDGATAPGSLGCTGVWNASSGMADIVTTVGPCDPGSGQSEF